MCLYKVKTKSISEDLSDSDRADHEEFPDNLCDFFRGLLHVVDKPGQYESVCT